MRGLDRTQLANLLRLRPDLALPRPASLAEVVERAGTHASTRAAIDSLDAWQRRVCHGLAACPDDVSVRHLAALLGGERGAVEHAVRGLRDRALVWGDDGHVRVTQAVRACFGSHPAGLAQPSATPLTDAEIDRRLREAGADSAPLVDQLLWGNPVGRVTGADRPVTLEQAESPTERLLALKLLRPLDADTVVLPREVALRVRGGRLFPDRIATQVPGWPAGSTSTIVEQAGLGTAQALVHAVASVVDEVERMSPRPLATGAFSRRDQAQIGQATGTDQTVVLLLHLAHRLGLVGRSAMAWLPTAGFDQWLALTPFARWQGLVKVWLDLPGWPLEPSAQTGRTDADSGERSLPERGRIAAARELRAAPVGAVLEPGLLADRLAWRHPTWSRVEIDHAAEQTLAEAAHLGLVAHLDHAGRPRRTSLWEVTDDPGFPEATTDFLVQSDLTAVAPGPLRIDIQRVLDLVADRESPGPASVHRFTASSVRRGLDAGWTGERLLAWLAEHSVTPIPQPLTYLVGDVARLHGAIRVASVGALLTIADEATVAALLRHPQASVLGLRQVAPGLVAARAEAADVVDLLRDLGHAPVAEDDRGDVVPTPPTRRLKQVAAPRSGRASVPSSDQVNQLAGELLAPSQSVQAAVDAESMLAALLEAQTGGSWVTLTRVDDSGRSSRVRAKVLAVASGQARIVEQAKGQSVVALSRIVRVEPVRVEGAYS
ncbi:helicase-associated domain-containing protein [Aestuariimicrobium soli]|uniref:helicase-associated domain-containing protein n=1 Tax=Aestuariimicrobium soli TaxID=2035834 RepID=UPI003EB886EA